MNRGSASAHDSEHPQTNRFNEAPIHESGKYSQVASCTSSASRFNEAPIHESGKSLSVLTIPVYQTPLLQ